MGGCCAKIQVVVIFEYVMSIELSKNPSLDVGTRIRSSRSPFFAHTCQKHADFLNFTQRELRRPNYSRLSCASEQEADRI